MGRSSKKAAKKAKKTTKRRLPKSAKKAAKKAKKARKNAAAAPVGQQRNRKIPGDGPAYWKQPRGSGYDWVTKKVTIGSEMWAWQMSAKWSKAQWYYFTKDIR